MTQQEAEQLIEQFGRSHGIQTGLNPSGVGGMAVGAASIYFEFNEKSGTLKSSALIYRFRETPKEGVLEGFRAEASTTSTGGGNLEFRNENKGLFLSREYAKKPDQRAFDTEQHSMMSASKVWADEVLDRVAAKVFQTKN